jgi:HD-like signal output (HDOD) protein
LGIAEMKPRNLLSPAEIEELQDFLDRKLDRIGVPSRPEVAVKLLDLSGNTTSTMKDFAEIIRVDQAMSGRIMRLANSPLFIQRTPVTNLDRACLVLGLDRIKAISLGLQLSRAAIPRGVKDVAREIWGQSVFRACFAAEAARVVAPALVPEAFLVGLMLDAGVPLMCKLVGDIYAALYTDCPSPGALFRRENDTLGFTHVDVVAGMARRWRLPELLTKPITSHHQRPADLRRPEPVHRLHRIAYAAGLLHLRPETAFDNGKAVLHGEGTAVTAQQLLGISEGEILSLIKNALAEYSAAIHAFADVAAAMQDLDGLVERVHVGLVRTIDDNVEQSIERQECAAPERLAIGGQSLELMRTNDEAVVYLYDSHGHRLLAHRFSGDDVSAQSIADAFGIEITDPGDRERLTQFLRKKAA